MFSFNICQIFLEQYFCQLIEYYMMLTNVFYSRWRAVEWEAAHKGTIFRTEFVEDKHNHSIIIMLHLWL